MGIEKLRMWHWCIIGLIAGAAIASIKLYAGPPEPKGLETVGPHVFEQQLVYWRDPKERGNIAGVTNIRLHPATEMPLPGEKVGETEYITYDLLVRMPKEPKKAIIEPRQMILQITPSKREPSLVKEVENLSIREYLDKLNGVIKDLDKKRYPHAENFTYKFNWWETPKGAYSIWMSGGFVAIGLIFPTLIQLLTVAGYGRERKTTEDEEYLARFKGGAEPEKAKAVIPVDAKEQLAQLEAELEAKLKAGASDAPAPAPAAAPAKPAIAVLTATKMEPAKTVEEKKAARKGYGTDQGDFYPTEVHGKK